MKPEYKVSMEVFLIVKLHLIRIVFHNCLRNFVLKVKKDLTVVQGKYAPNPQQDQLAVLKVTFITITEMLTLAFSLLNYLNWSSNGFLNRYDLQPKLLCLACLLVGLLTFSLFFIWGNTIQNSDA